MHAAHALRASQFCQTLLWYVQKNAITDLHRSGTEEFVSKKVEDLQFIYNMKQEGDRIKAERSAAAKDARTMKKRPASAIVDERLVKMRAGEMYCIAGLTVLTCPTCLTCWHVV